MANFKNGHMMVVIARKWIGAKRLQKRIFLIIEGKGVVA